MLGTFRSRVLVLAMSALALSGAGVSPLALADSGHDDGPHYGHDGGHDSGPRGGGGNGGGWHHEGSWHGAVVPILPPRHRTVYYGGLPYYFDAGLWYRPWGGNFVVVTPPVGIVQPFLPDGYVTITLGDRVYYRADNVYYTRANDGYIVVDPPADNYTPAATTRSEDLYIYPSRGQSETEQRQDRFECHEWAVQQTGFNPTQADGSLESRQAGRSEYLRAMSACLQGRGYTVR